MAVVKAQIHAGGRGKGGGVKVAKSADEAEADRQGHPRHAARHAPDRPGRPACRRACSSRKAWPSTASSTSACVRRPRDRQHRADGQRRRRRGHRGGGRQDARADPQGASSTRASGLLPFQAQQLAFAIGLDRRPRQEGRQGDAGALPGVRRDRRVAARDQPAHRDRGRRPAGARRQDELRRQRALPPRRHPRPARPRARRIRSRSRRRSSRSTTSASTATSAAWSTAPAWPWRRWTSSSSRAGEPANFLDVGGGANAEQIRNAFKILMSDTNVKAVLINIFGGILRCDVLAAGVIAAVKELGVPVPIVIRMKGTNVDEGKQMLAESGLNFTTADTMGEAAEQVVALAAELAAGAGSDYDGGPDRLEHATDRPGPDRPRRHLPRQGGAAYHTNVVGGVTPGKGGTTHEGWPVFNTVADAVADDRRERLGHLRAAAVCGRRHHGGGRCRYRPGRLHHRGHSGRRHDQGDDLPAGAARHPAHRAELPGHHLARQGQGGHHPGQHLQGRPDRHRVEERHAHLRGDRPADAPRATGRRPASASAAIRSSARPTSTRWRSSRTIPTPMPSS